jgi:hypothetical protein
LADASGHANQATLAGGMILGAPGGTGGDAAISLDGPSGYASASAASHSGTPAGSPTSWATPGWATYP